MKNYSNHVAVIGAGIAGLTLGNILRINNIPCVVFEKSNNVKEQGAGISISYNGLKVLDYLNVLEAFNNISRQPKKAIFFSNNNKIKHISTDITTASRKNLYKVLLDNYLSLKGEIYFNHELKNINQYRNKIFFSNNNSYHVSHIAACDGIKSTCQSILSTSFVKPIYSGYYIWRTIFEYDQENIHFHLGSNFHVVTYPIDKKRISLVAAIKSKNKEIESWKQEGDLDDLLTEVPHSILNRYQSIKKNDGVYKWGVYIRPNALTLIDKNISYLGDSAHPMVPFIGQGACMSLEDAYTYGYMLSKYNNDLPKAQNEYNKFRINRVKSIYTKSLNQGKLNHLSNPFLVYLRNILMKYTNVIKYRTNQIWSYDVTSMLKK
ncbi:MAG: hypothetical protein EVA93_02180 [SAR86 cluster bacterium]|jgi:salicylate hydroxylase|uniref:FAD-binding domain-containing protein n=1 Tax=SAR86 cluster bacterium TaxID=2030880 RepID=A0A520N392_9GAMM|nr:MAG: hypothetical protein EVA93_02180 [SAR86 cluster bacterium]|tara:strand:- start:2632 stop:3762 length:1131 start_codon:yes stop_codon:yes gene_type:complete